MPDRPTRHTAPIALSVSAHDRVAGRRTDEAWLAEVWAADRTRVLALQGGRLLVEDDAARPAWLRPADAPAGQRVLLGDRGGAVRFAVLVDEVPEGWRTDMRARRDFSVVGDAMNTASRVENANETLGTTFLVSEALHERLPVPVREGQRTHTLLKGKGGFHSLIEVRGFAEPDVDFIVQCTARQLLGDQDRFGEVFYRRLFGAAPATRHLFSGNVEAQGRMLTQVLQVAVYGLSRFDEVARGLSVIGQNHVGYGVTAAHYEVFRKVFVDTVAEVLGAAFNADVEAAWTVVVNRILDAIQGRREKTPAAESELEVA